MPELLNNFWEMSDQLSKWNKEVQAHAIWVAAMKLFVAKAKSDLVHDRWIIMVTVDPKALGSNQPTREANIAMRLDMSTSTVEIAEAGLLWANVQLELTKLEYRRWNDMLRLFELTDVEVIKG